MHKQTNRHTERHPNTERQTSIDAIRLADIIIDRQTDRQAGNYKNETRRESRK